MKTRNGFVSNSSTSSFVILGVADPSAEILAKFGELQASYHKGETQTRYCVDSEDGRFAGISLGESDMVVASFTDILKMAPGVAALLGVKVEDLKVMGVEVMS